MNMLKQLQETDLLEGVAGAKALYVDTKKMSPNVLKKLEALDPTDNKKYVEWMARCFVSGARKLAQYEVIKKFDELLRKNKIPADSRDINKYKTPEELYDMVKHHDTPSKTEVKKQIKTEEAEVVFENDQVRVIMPKTQEASCIYGKGTKWCTAATDVYNYFNDYYFSRANNIYYVIRKQPKGDRFDKIAVTVDSSDHKTYWDIADEQLKEAEALRELKKLGVPA